MEHRTEANTNSTLGRLTVPKWKKIRSIVKIKRKSEMALPRNHLSKQKAGMCPNWPAGPLLRNTDGDHFHQPLVAEESRSYDKRKKKAGSKPNRCSSIQETSDATRPEHSKVCNSPTHSARSPSWRSTPTRPAMATPSSNASGSSSSPGAAYSSGSDSPYSLRIRYRIISARPHWLLALRELLTAPALEEPPRLKAWLRGGG
jgi:hypothetical protein